MQLAQGQAATMEGSVSTRTALQKYLHTLKKKGELAGRELHETKHREGMLQMQKEELLQEREQCHRQIEDRKRNIEATREKLPSERAKRMFNDIIPLVDDCYHQQLLISELKQQLTLAKALREKRDCLHLIQGLTGSQDATENHVGPNILCGWYQEMKEHWKISSNNSDQSICDEYFYSIKLTSDECSPHSMSLKLSFSTRHKGYCVHVTITHARFSVSNSHAVSVNAGGHFTITSDIGLEGLAEQGKEALSLEKSASEFLCRVLWPLMDEQICV